MKTHQIIQLAKKHVGKGNRTAAAQWCLNEAIHGDPEYARSRAIKSLAYSVGVYHEDYIQASVAPLQGGRRDGAGRKLMPGEARKVKLSISLSPEAFQIAKQKESVSRFIQDLIMNAK